MSTVLNIEQPTPDELAQREHCSLQNVHLNAYVVTRIVYEVIRKSLMENPDNGKTGVVLPQTYNNNPTKSDILLDMGYTWRGRDLSKVPAIFVKRGDLTFQPKTIGQDYSSNVQTLSQTKFVFAFLPVTVQCVAAEPVAVVENLAELVKNALLYYRKEIQDDFSIRQFKLNEVTSPKLIPEGKNNFLVELNLGIVYDDGWTITQDALKIGSIRAKILSVNNELLNAVII